MDGWSVLDSGNTEIMLCGRSDGSVGVEVTALGSYPVVTVFSELTPDQALSLAGWLALGAGYVLAIDQTGSQPL